jgi:hypothetical protein
MKILKKQKKEIYFKIRKFKRKLKLFIDIQIIEQIEF